MRLNPSENMLIEALGRIKWLSNTRAARFKNAQDVVGALCTIEKLCANIIGLQEIKPAGTVNGEIVYHKFNNRLN